MRAVLLMGPTASGKSSLAMKFAETTAIEIISVDSAQVYRGLDIGTAKPSVSEQRQVPHHLIDIRDPADAYSAGEFRRDALQLIGEILERQRLPVLVGGTMLYFRALTQGLADLPEADDKLRRQLDDEAERIGWPAMHRRLASVDPEAASKIQPGDAQRIQRALEVFSLSGEPLSALQKRTVKTSEVDFLPIALWPADRDQHHRRIEKRFAQMMRDGFADEVRALHEREDLSPGLPAIRAVGYRQLWDHFDGISDLDSAIAQALIATRRLAKRQLTWLRSESDIRRLSSLDSEDVGPISEIVACWRENGGESPTLC